MITAGERYRRVLSFQSVDRVPNVDHGPMGPRLIEDWRRQGLPAGVSLGEFFHLESPTYVINRPCNGSYDPIPGVEGQGLVAEDGDHSLHRDCWGRVTEWFKRPDLADNHAFRIARNGIEGWEDWERIRTHFRPDEPMRYPGGYDPSRSPAWVPNLLAPPYPFQGHAVTYEELRALREGGRVITLNGPSMAGGLKEAMGWENLCLAPYLDRPLIDEIVGARTEIGCALVEQVMDHVHLDTLHFWEDIAFKNGPMISPALLADYALGPYRRLTDLFRSKGGEYVSVDCDGDIHMLIPFWLEAGVNLFFPLEVQSNMDVVRLRAEYGRSFAMIGGVDKRVLLQGKEAIDRELDRIAPVVAGGGYIPTIDHTIPYGVPFETYCYYMEKKAQLLG